MRSFKKLFLFLVELHAAFMVCALILKRRYAAQELGIDQVNAIGILGGAEEFSASQDFRGGYVRAMIGGVELDLTNAAIEAPPVTIEATVIMGGARSKSRRIGPSRSKHEPPWAALKTRDTGTPRMTTSPI